MPFEDSKTKPWPNQGEEHPLLASRLIGISLRFPIHGSNFHDLLSVNVRMRLVIFLVSKQKLFDGQALPSKRLRKHVSQLSGGPRIPKNGNQCGPRFVTEIWAPLADQPVVCRPSSYKVKLK